MKTQNNLPLDTLVMVDDGEIKVTGLIKSTFRKKLLIEMDADSAPLCYSLDAVEAAVQGFDLDHFPSRIEKRYIPFEINESLIITPILSAL